MVGDSTLPLAMLVVGGSLGLIAIRRVQLKPVVLLILAKLLILPALGLLFIWRLSLPHLFGLLIIMQLAMPSATSLSLIITHYKRKDLLISQGVLLTHLFSLISIPLFLSLVWIR
jgi:predicted permease